MNSLFLVSTWSNAYEIGSPINKNVLQILLDIQTGTHKVAIERIRQTISKDQRNKLKAQLEAVYFSGIFSNRKKEHLLRHTGLICLDVDNVSVQHITDLKARLQADKYILAYFISPSGNGLKILVKIPANPKKHLNSYLSLEAYFKTKYQTSLDRKCKNINRFCYVSFDSNLYINKRSEVFTQLLKPQTSTTKKRTTSKPKSDTSKQESFVNEDSPLIDKLDLAAKLMEGKFYEGNKHTATGTFALYCNKMGIDQQDAEDYFYSNFPKNKCNAFQQEYKKTEHQNTWDWIEPYQEQEDIVELEDY